MFQGERAAATRTLKTRWQSSRGNLPPISGDRRAAIMYLFTYTDDKDVRQLTCIITTY